MQFLTTIFISTFSISLALGQSQRTLQYVRQEPTGGYLLVLMEDSIRIDTLVQGSVDKLLDYVILAEDKIAVLTGSFEHISYFQFYKSNLYQFWTIDSSAMWALPSASPLLNPSSYREPRGTFELQGFYTVVKVVDQTKSILDLQQRKAEHAQPPMHERELEFVLLSIADNPERDWKAVDSFFRNHILQTSSNRLRHMAFMQMVLRKEFLEKADESTLTYYALELEKLDFNYDINFYIMFMKKLAIFWTPEAIGQYAKNFYKKHTIYWKRKHKTNYWDSKEDELNDLKSLMKNK